jgi:penicillin-binding protein 2
MMCGIGQSYVLASPLQLAQMMARLVNGGKAVEPFLVREKLEGGSLVGRNTDYQDLGVNPVHLERVKQGFVRVINSPFGTAYRQRVTEKGFEIAGKSSTTQVRSISKKEREQGVIKNENLEWKLRDHGMFFGFAPADNPRFAVAVVIEHGGGGGRVAAPIAKDVLLALQKKYR